MLKVCRKCSAEKDETLFTASRGFKDWCKECVNANAVRYRASRSEKQRKAVADKSREVYLANREERLARAKERQPITRELHKAWRIKNQEYLEKYSKKHCAENKERRKQTTQAWRDDHPGIGGIYNVRRRLRKQEVESTFTYAEWLEILEVFGHRCAYCLRADVSMTRDHVIPLSKGGPDTADNIVPACHSCNSKKNDKSLLRISSWLLSASEVVFERKRTVWRRADATCKKEK